MVYNPYFELCALAFLSMVTLFFFFKEKLYTLSSKLYGGFLCIMLCNLTMDVLSAYTITYSTVVPLWCNMLVNTLVFILQIMLPGMFMIFIMGLANCIGHTKKDLVLCFCLLIPCLLAILMVLVNLLDGGLFYFDQAMQYTHGSAFGVLYSIVAFYMVCGLYFLWRYRKRMRPVQFWVILTYAFLLAGAVILQYFFPHYLLTGAAVSLALCSMYFTFQNPDDYIDKLTGLYTRSALFVMRAHELRRRREYVLLFLDIREFKAMNHLFGLNGGDLLLRQVAEFLVSITKDRRQRFRMGGDQFALIVEPMQLPATLEKLNRRMAEGFSIFGSKLHLSMCLCALPLSQPELSDDVLMAVLEYAIGLAKKRPESGCLQVDETVIDQINRRLQIESTLRSMEENHCLHLHFQPIYSVEEGRFAAAEVLLRMQDPKLGAVYPDEFIAVAEQNGLICQVSQFVLKRAVQFLQKNPIWELGVHTLEINLSLAELLQENPAERIRAAVEQLPNCPTRLNLEITETTAALSAQKVRDMMNDLAEVGVSFSLDDYSQGYANGNAIVQFPFALVKMDRELLWDAMKQEKAKIFYCNTVKMIQEMNMKIVAEGAETAEQVALLTELGVEFIQGFYYSRPLSETQYLAFLMQNQMAAASSQMVLLQGEER